MIYFHIKLLGKFIFTLKNITNTYQFHIRKIKMLAFCKNMFEMLIRSSGNWLKIINIFFTLIVSCLKSAETPPFSIARGERGRESDVVCVGLRGDSASYWYFSSLQGKPGTNVLSFSLPA